MKPTLVQFYNVAPSGKRKLWKKFRMPLTLALDWIDQAAQQMSQDGWFVKTESNHSFTFIRGIDEDSCQIVLVPTH